MSRVRVGIVVFFLTSGVLPLLGCGSGPGDLNPVSGVVTLDGEPLAGATVNFSPTSDSTGRPAVGTTNDQGVYELTDMQHSQAGPGVAAGEYRVSITKTSGGNRSMPDEHDPDNPDNEGLPDPTAGGAAAVKSLVPDKYTDRSSSGLIATIESGKNENVDFELTSN